MARPRSSAGRKQFPRNGNILPPRAACACSHWRRNKFFHGLGGSRGSDRWDLCDLSDGESHPLKHWASQRWLHRYDGDMKIVPTISSDTTGPLGVAHLPRLWQKVLLAEKGLLPAGYDFCGQGFDQLVLDGLGLDREETLAYLKTLPTYFAFEKWILARNARQARCASRGKSQRRDPGLPPFRSRPQGNSGRGGPAGHGAVHGCRPPQSFRRLDGIPRQPEVKNCAWQATNSLQTRPRSPTYFGRN